MNKSLRIIVIFLILYLSIGILIASIFAAMLFFDGLQIFPKGFIPLFLWSFWFLITGLFFIPGFPLAGFFLGGVITAVILFIIFLITKKIDKKLFKTKEEELQKEQISSKTLVIIGASILLVGVINIFLLSAFSVFLIPAGIIIGIIGTLRRKKS